MNEKNKTTSLIITGVGGQGTLLAGRVIGRAALAKGFDVKISEVHGMSQRGGNVITYARFSSDSINSPIVDVGCADIVLAFELMEGFRALPYLKKGGKLILNTQCISPMPVLTGAAKYNENIIEKIKAKGVDVITTDAFQLAKDAGSPKAVNIALVGIFAALTEIEKNFWIESLKNSVPSAFLDVNVKAFDAGYGLVG